MEKTYFSNRIYKKTLTSKEIYSITQTLSQFNRARHKAYKLLLAEHNYGVKHEKSVHLQIKEIFNFNDYYANSAVQDARAQISSQKELQKVYIAGLQEQVKTKRDKLKGLNKKIGQLGRLLLSIIKGKFKTWRGSNIVKRDSGIISVDLKRKSLVFYNIYDFEKQYLRPEIRRLKNRAKLIKYSITRLEEKLGKLRSGFLKGCVFGTKDLFKKQFTVEEYRNNHDAWLEEWRRARYSSMRISGRLDAKYGNFVFKYDVQTNTLKFDLQDGITVKVPVTFKYGQEEVNNAILHIKERRKPIAWTIEDHGDYYIFKVTVDVPKNPYINYYKCSGVIGVDMNFDRAALAETNCHGNLIDWLVIPYDMEGLAKGQIIKVLEQVAIDIIDIAKLKKKPIIIEDLVQKRRREMAACWRYGEKTEKNHSRRNTRTGVITARKKQSAALLKHLHPEMPYAG